MGPAVAGESAETQHRAELGRFPSFPHFRTGSASSGIRLCNQNFFLVLLLHDDDEMAEHCWTAHSKKPKRLPAGNIREERFECHVECCVNTRSPPLGVLDDEDTAILGFQQLFFSEQEPVGSRSVKLRLGCLSRQLTNGTHWFCRWLGCKASTQRNATQRNIHGRLISSKAYALYASSLEFISLLCCVRWVVFGRLLFPFSLVFFIIGMGDGVITREFGVVFEETQLTSVR